MKTDKSFAEIFDRTRKSDAFSEEAAILSFTGSVMERLHALGMTKGNLADLLNVTPAYVTKLIGGSNNFTLRTMVKIARQLKCDLKINLRPAVASAKSDPLKCETADLPCEKMLKRAANDYEDLALAA